MRFFFGMSFPFDENKCVSLKDTFLSTAHSVYPDCLRPIGFIYYWFPNSSSSLIWHPINFIFQILCKLYFFRLLVGFYWISKCHLKVLQPQAQPASCQILCVVSLCLSKVGLLAHRLLPESPNPTRPHFWTLSDSSTSSVIVNKPMTH